MFPPTDIDLDENLTKQPPIPVNSYFSCPRNRARTHTRQRFLSPQERLIHTNNYASHMDGVVQNCVTTESKMSQQSVVPTRARPWKTPVRSARQCLATEVSRCAPGSTITILQGGRQTTVCRVGKKFVRYLPKLTQTLFLHEIREGPGSS